VGLLSGEVEGTRRPQWGPGSTLMLAGRLLASGPKSERPEGRPGGSAYPLSLTAEGGGVALRLVATAMTWPGQARVWTCRVAGEMRGPDGLGIIRIFLVVRLVPVEVGLLMSERQDRNAALNGPIEPRHRDRAKLGDRDIPIARGEQGNAEEKNQGGFHWGRTRC
jgi:hypothetical protein